MDVNDIYIYIRITFLEWCVNCSNNQVLRTEDFNNLTPEFERYKNIRNLSDFWGIFSTNENEVLLNGGQQLVCGGRGIFEGHQQICFNLLCIPAIC